jgi:hypothetical protein
MAACMDGQQDSKECVEVLLSIRGGGLLHVVSNQLSAHGAYGHRFMLCDES